MVLFEGNFSFCTHHSGITITSHQSRQVITFALGFSKDEDFVVRFATNLLKKSCQFLFFLVLLTYIDDLQNVVVGMQILRPNVDMRVIGKEILCQPPEIDQD